MSGSNKSAVETLMGAFEVFKSNHAENLNKRDEALKSEIKEIQSQTDRIEELLNRPFALDSFNRQISGSKEPGRYAVTADGKKLPILGKNDRLANYIQPTNENRDWSIGDFVRASMGIPIRNASVLERSTATVPEFLTNRIVDAVRVKNTLVNAGSSTLPIDGPSVLGRIDADPTAYVHAEGVADITPSLPTFTPLTLDPKMLVCQIPLSEEAVADSVNLDAMLQTSIAAAISGKLDSIGITALLSDAAIEESSAAHDPALWSGVTGAVGAHLLSNGSVPKALIANSAEFNARSVMITGSGDWLSAPAYLSGMLDLHSSRMTAGKAIMGDFSTGLLLAVRQGLRLELIRWSGMTDASHMLVAYMRAGFYVVQPKSLFRLLKVVE